MTDSFPRQSLLFVHGLLMPSSGHQEMVVNRVEHFMYFLDKQKQMEIKKKKIIVSTYEQGKSQYK